MITRFIESIEQLFLDFNVKRLFYIIFLLLLGFIGVWLYEGLSGHFYFSRLEHRIDLLEKAYRLQSGGIKSDPNLSPIYAEIIKDLQEQPTFSINLTKVSLSQNLWLFLSGVSLWFILALYYYSEVRNGNRTAVAGVYGALVFGIFCGVLNMALPMKQPMVNYGLLPFLLFGVTAGLLLLTAKLLRTKRKSSPR